MNKNAHLLAPLSAVMLGCGTLPGWADTATVQSSTQEATVIGTNNQVIQVINQYNLTNPGRGVLKRNQGRGDNTGTIQSANQGVLVQGQDNQVQLESTQVNQVERGRSNEYAKDHGKGHAKKLDKNRENCQD
jgi:hypothetical protein